MKWLRLLLCLGSYLLAPSRFLWTQEPICPSAEANNYPLPPVPTDPEQPFPDFLPNEAAATDPFSSVLTPPGMFGDLLQIQAFRQTVGGRIEALTPLAFRSSFRISDNESPRPLDRVFVTGQYFNGVGRSFFASNSSYASVYREMIGLEKTFLQGNASIGLRVPYFQLTGDPGLNETRLGDISVLLKYAFVNHPSAGHVFSGGLVITTPTGPALHFPGQSTANPVLIQPWLGDIWNWNRFFAQGFLSVAVPTDARTTTLLFKSIGVGYWLYRSEEPNRFLSAIVPDAELHFTEPLNHVGLGSFPIGFPVILDFTGGFYVFFRRAVLGIGMGTPLTGPKPYEYQVITNLNYRF